MLDKSQLQAQGIHTIDTTPPPESQKLIALLKEHAPHAFRDGKLDLKALASLLGEETEYASYELNFLGKREANKLSSTPATKELKSEPDRSIDFETTGNAIIIGDNLHALKTLRAAYHGKVKMIYIDPPYNTGSDGFIYRDHFSEDYKNILRELNLMEFNDDGEEMLSKRINYFKNIFGDKTHSGWLSFMYPRLRLAQDLLRDDGVIFISIDDNEQANLKILCDEIFGEHNFVACLIWRKIEENASSGGTMKKTTTFRKDHEYLLCYTKDNDLFRTRKYLELPNFENEYKNPDNDPRGAFKAGSISMKGNQKSPKYYEIATPSGKKYSRVWRITKEEFKKLDEDNRIYYGKKQDSVPQIKIFINEERPVTPKSILEGLGSAFLASEKLTKLLQQPKECRIFDNPKPLDLIKRLMEVSTNDGDIVMDFFAGSGTTAHAVMELNAEDKNNGKQGNRKFILVQLDEAIDEKANKVAYDFCKSLGSENPTIADITIERVKRAGEKIREKCGDSAVDTGFKVFSLIDKQALAPQDQDLLTLASSPLTPYQKAINLALHAGKTLDTRIQPVIEGKLYRDERNFYLIACDKEVQKHLASHKNEEIFLSGYEDIAIQDLLNLQASIQKTRLKVLF